MGRLEGTSARNLIISLPSAPCPWSPELCRRFISVFFLSSAYLWSCHLTLGMGHQPALCQLCGGFSWLEAGSWLLWSGEFAIGSCSGRCDCLKGSQR